MANDMPKMFGAFRTTVSCGGDKPTYEMVFKFASMEDMHAADDEWHAYREALRASPSPTSTNAEHNAVIRKVLENSGILQSPAPDLVGEKLHDKAFKAGWNCARVKMNKHYGTAEQYERYRAESFAAWREGDASPAHPEPTSPDVGVKARELFEVARPCFHYAKRGTGDGNLFEHSETGTFLMRAMQKIAALLNDQQPTSDGGAK